MIQKSAPSEITKLTDLKTKRYTSTKLDIGKRINQIAPAIEHANETNVVVCKTGNGCRSPSAAVNYENVL